MRSPDPELYKDKIEVSLDGRQVFYLFFGGAVIACLVFVLGVMVGRRVEARAHVDRGAATSTARDPLAALDQLDARAREDMSFRSSLATGKATTSEVDDAVKAIEEARAAAAAKPDVKPAAKPQVKPEPKPEVKPEVKPAAKPEAKPAPKPEAKPAAKPDEADDAEEAPRAKFTLQLSSFQDKGEAEAFLATVKAQGYKAYIVQAEVEGKGRFYRVRVGQYESYDRALEAKAEFERDVKKIAYVTRL